VNDIEDFNNPDVRQQDDNGIYEPDVFRSPIGEDNFWDQDKDVLFHSYEDVVLRKLDFEKNRSVVGPSKKSFSILIVRDPFNLFASRYAKPNWPAVKISDRTIKIWKQHMKEARGFTDMLPNRVVVGYNQWVTSSEYRRDIETRLGLGITDNGIKDDAGLGSSFSGDNDFLNRWKRFQDDPVFRKFFNDDELWALSKTFFGHIEGAEVLR
jgi:hypothetical protein